LQARDYKGINSDDAHAGGKLIVYETHPADSRINEMGETCQTVTSRWGTGGGNVPLVQAFRKSRRAQSTEDYETWVDDGKANTLNTFDLGDIRTTHAIAFEPGIAKREGGDSRFTKEKSPTLRKEMGDNQVAVAYPIHPQALQFEGGGKNRNNDGKGNGLGIGENGEPMNTLTTIDRHIVAHTKHLYANMAVRRLTPMECERLQGFPDNYTDIKPKSKATPDGPRYKALGNSMAVPCMAWIGEGIDMIENP
jgi:DNA (cytosine-5)-methyltransferase 1